MADDKMTDKIATVTTTALARPIAKAQDIIDAHRDVVELIQNALVDGEDYGVIPGADKKKPVLLKPGAERLAIAFGARPEFDIIESEVNHDRPVEWKKRKGKWDERRREKVWTEETGQSLGLYRYVMRCRLRRGGEVLGEGVGSASTMEAKYVAAPRDAENTILKMAKKRALVDAVLTMAGLSNRFTQDVDDMSIDLPTPDAPRPTFAAPAAPPPQPAAAPKPTALDAALSAIASATTGAHLADIRARVAASAKLGDVDKAKAAAAIDARERELVGKVVDAEVDPAEGFSRE